MKKLFFTLIYLNIFLVKAQDTTRLKLYEMKFDLINDTNFLFTRQDSTYFSKGNYIIEAENQKYKFSVNENGKINGILLCYNFKGEFVGEFNVDNGLVRERKDYKNEILQKHEIISYVKREIRVLLYEKNVLYGESIADMAMSDKLKMANYSSITPQNYFSLKLFYPNGKLKQTSVLKNMIITSKDFSEKGVVTKITKKYAKPGLPDVNKALKNKIDKTTNTNSNSLNPNNH
jgi:hypothetical protein